MPLPHLLLVCTTLVCVLFVATPMSSISVYYFSMCVHEGHVYCLWPLPHVVLVCTTLVCVLFVATPMSTVSVYYFSLCVYPCSITICCISAYTIIIWLLQCKRRVPG